MEMSYSKQLWKITRKYGFLHYPTCCNGKVYSLISPSHNRYVIQVHIVVRDREVVINLLPFRELPIVSCNGCLSLIYVLKGYCSELFYIVFGLNKVETKTLGAVYLFKLDMTSMSWKEIEYLKDAIFFVDFASDYSVF